VIKLTGNVYGIIGISLFCFVFQLNMNKCTLVDNNFKDFFFNVETLYLLFKVDPNDSKTKPGV
jgi:hypothetical protein